MLEVIMKLDAGSEKAGRQEGKMMNDMLLLCFFEQVLSNLSDTSLRVYFGCMVRKCREPNDQNEGVRKIMSDLCLA